MANLIATREALERFCHELPQAGGGADRLRRNAIHLESAKRHKGATSLIDQQYPPQIGTDDLPAHSLVRWVAIDKVYYDQQE